MSEYKFEDLDFQVHSMFEYFRAEFLFPNKLAISVLVGHKLGSLPDDPTLYEIALLGEDGKYVTTAHNLNREQVEYAMNQIAKLTSIEEHVNWLKEA